MVRRRLKVFGYQFTIGGGPASSSGRYVLFQGASLCFQDFAGVYWMFWCLCPLITGARRALC